MLDTILIGLSSVIRRTEDLVRKAHRAVASGRLDEVESYNVYVESQKMTDVLLVLEAQVRNLGRAFEATPEMARRFTLHAKLQ
ncbi:hypothetical protein DTW90_28890 [Neorhizobium sp. P12A]|uniref:hypothetical protein n=1 Tax=Rhizobium/Agrobacterium group TaxID=227290 RepID=UPI001045C3D1|nr:MULTISPECIES: hypothetical protein [Rhizobium/Agrobacterium group]KAA0690923.1 hypothetical protein DTW90_28890 [Neorhizobium sp. P12A]